MSRKIKYPKTGVSRPAEVKCESIRLILGLVKAGKTYAEIIRMRLDVDRFSILVGTGSVDAKEQAKGQALAIGYKEEDIILCENLPKGKNPLIKYSLKGKLLIVNMNVNYGHRVLWAIKTAHSQGLEVNFTHDEYDLQAPFLQVCTHMSEWEIMQLWLGALQPGDILTLVSATNAVAWYAPLRFTEIKRITPYKDSYIGFDQLNIKSFKTYDMEQLKKGILTDNVLSTIASLAEIDNKVLIKITNRVNEKEDTAFIKGLQADLEKRGISTYAYIGGSEVEAGSRSKVLSERYKNAKVVLAGQLANRTMEFPDIGVQIYSFSNNLATIIQGLRIMGYRKKDSAVVFVPSESKATLEEAIRIETGLYNTSDEEWMAEEREPIEHMKGLQILPDKIALVETIHKDCSPIKVIDISIYEEYFKDLYPMVDSLEQKTNATINYQGRSPQKYWENTINTFSQTRISNFGTDKWTNRHFFIPDPSGNVDKPIKGETSLVIGLSKNYRENMTQFATYYGEWSNAGFKLKVGLYDGATLMAGERSVTHYREEFLDLP